MKGPRDRYAPTRVAGSDTREAAATPTVRAAAAAAMLAAGPGWFAALALPVAWRDHLHLPSGVVPWVATTWVAIGVVAAIVAWTVDRSEAIRDQVAHSPPAPPPPPPPPVSGLIALFAIVLLGFVAAATGDAKLAALTMLFIPPLAGWVVGRCARLAVKACVDPVSAAAAGRIIAMSIAGTILSGHLALVATGSGLPRASGWTAAYAALSAFWVLRARRNLESDRRRIGVRALRSGSLEQRAFAAGEATGAAFFLDAIDVRFPGNHVLRGATLEAKRGELVALCGGNGAGKSTLLRVAAGLIAADSGGVIVGGQDLTTLRSEERAAAGLAFVSGARPVFPDLTVWENLRVAAFRTHLTPRSFGAATNAILQLVPTIAARRSAKAGVLSGGEQRLLAVAQTLYRMPVALLADELSLGLDLEARLAVLDLLRLLAEEGVAVVCVDHDLASLLPRADRAALLAHGVVEDFDQPEALLARHDDMMPATFLAGAT